MPDYVDEQLDALGFAQVIVVLKQDPETAVAARSVRVRRLVGPTPRTLATALSLPTGKRLAKRPPPMRVFEHLGIMLATVDKHALHNLRADKGNVQEVLGAPVLSLIRPHVRSTTASPTAVATWGIAALDADKAWKQGFTGKGVLVGHLDTGVDGKHPCLKTAIGAFAEFDNTGNMVPNAKAHDTDEHGTHTAATIVGRAVKIGGRMSYVGVAPEAKLASALVIEGGDVVARVLGGLNWAVGKGARVLSMSLGIRGYTPAFQSITRILRQRGVLPVFAVGNEGSGTSRSPGNYPEALSVGAMDRKKKVADFSSSQRFARAVDPLVPDLIGPGVDVISAKPGGGFQSMDGTSMATPHIAGLAALLFQKKPSASPDEVEKAIFSSCRRSPGMPESRGNRGCPNALLALAAI